MRMAAFIRSQYTTLFGIFAVALLTWTIAARLYKFFKLTPKTEIKSGSLLESVVWALEKPSSIVILLISIFTSIVAAYLLWRLENWLREASARTVVRSRSNSSISLHFLRRTGIYLLGRFYRLLNGSWRSAATVGVIAIYSAGANAAAALIGLYMMDLVPSLSNTADLVSNLIPFGVFFLTFPLFAGILLFVPPE